jgi:hypothetical protein
MDDSCGWLYAGVDQFFLLIAYVGYMPLEYAIDGLFSLNSDVFSFDKHKIYVCHIIVCTYIEFSP